MAGSSLRRLAAAGGCLIGVALLFAGCSSGTAARTTTDSSLTSAPVTSGSISTGPVTTGTIDTGSYDGPYCRAARIYDADLSHFSADDTKALNQAVKDITDLHKKAPMKVRDDYAVLLSTLQEVQSSGVDAPTSDELGNYHDAFHNVIDFDHAHCGLPLYGDTTSS